MNPGGHALGRRVSELRVAAAGTGRRGLGLGSRRHLRPVGRRQPLHRGHGGTGATCPGPGGRAVAVPGPARRPAGPGRAADGRRPRGRLPRRSARGPAQRPRHRRGTRRPSGWRRRRRLVAVRRLVAAGHLARRPARLPAGCTRAGAPDRGGDRRRVARAGPSPRPGDSRGRPAGRRAAGPPGAGGGPRRHRRSSRAHRDRPAGRRRRADPDRVDSGGRGRRPRRVGPLGRDDSRSRPDARRAGGTVGRGPCCIRPQPCRDRQPRGAARAGRPRRAEPRARAAPVAGAPGAPRVRGRRVPGCGRPRAVAVARRADRGGGPAGGRGQRPSVAPTPRAAGAAASDPGQGGGGGPRRGPVGVRAGGAGGTVTGRPL